MRHLRLLVLIMMALLMCQAGALASDFGDRVKDMAAVTEVRVSKQDSKVRIVVEADKEVEFKKMVLSNPERVVVDLPNAWLSPRQPWIQISEACLQAGSVWRSSTRTRCASWWRARWARTTTMSSS